MSNETTLTSLVSGQKTTNHPYPFIGVIMQPSNFFPRDLIPPYTTLFGSGFCSMNHGEMKFYGLFLLPLNTKFGDG